MGKKGPLWWRESDWLLRGSSAANQILLRHSGPILSYNPYIENAQEKQDSLEPAKESMNAISINTNITKTMCVRQITSGNVYMTGLPTT